MKLSEMDGEIRNAIVTFVFEIWVFLVIIWAGIAIIKGEGESHLPTQPIQTEETGYENPELLED